MICWYTFPNIDDWRPHQLQMKPGARPSVKVAAFTNLLRSTLNNNNKRLGNGIKYRHDTLSQRFHDDVERITVRTSNKSIEILPEANKCWKKTCHLSNPVVKLNKILFNTKLMKNKCITNDSAVVSRFVVPHHSSVSLFISVQISLGFNLGSSLIHSKQTGTCILSPPGIVLCRRTHQTVPSQIIAKIWIDVLCRSQSSWTEITFPRFPRYWSSVEIEHDWTPFWTRHSNWTDLVATNFRTHHLRSSVQVSFRFMQVDLFVICIEVAEHCVYTTRWCCYSLVLLWIIFFGAPHIFAHHHRHWNDTRPHVERSAIACGVMPVTQQ